MGCVEMGRAAPLASTTGKTCNGECADTSVGTHTPTTPIAHHSPDSPHTPHPLPLCPTHPLTRVRIADGPLDDLNGRQQGVDAPGHDGLGRATPPRNRHAAQVRVARAQEQRLRGDTMSALGRKNGNKAM